jgi:hypothetical protein
MEGSLHPNAMRDERRDAMKDDADTNSSAGGSDASGKGEANVKELGQALTKALDRFFADLEVISGTSLEFAGQEDERSQPIDEVASWLFREEGEDDPEQQQ